MPIVASCGHVLSDTDGNDGMGHMLHVKSFSSEGTPAVEYRCYCSKCRDSALAEPGHVLHTEEQQLAWLKSTG